MISIAMRRLIIGLALLLGASGLKADDEVIVLEPFVVWADAIHFDWNSYYVANPPPTHVDIDYHVIDGYTFFQMAMATSGDGQANWHNASKAAVNTATGKAAGIADGIKNDPTVKAAFDKMLADTKASYNRPAGSNLPSAQENGIGYWVDANGHRVSAVVEESAGSNPAYSPGQNGSVGIDPPTAPADAVTFVQAHTHAWGADMSGGPSNVGDWAPVNNNNDTVITVPMGANTFEMVSDHSAYQGTPGDVGLTSTQADWPAGYP